MAKFKKKPVEIEAIQWDGTENSSHEILRFCDTATWHVLGNIMMIDTLEGTLQVSVNDWVIKGVKGEFYPCKPDIFKLTYDQI